MLLFWSNDRKRDNTLSQIQNQLTSKIRVPTISLRWIMGTIFSPLMMVATPTFLPTILRMSFSSRNPRIMEFLSQQIFPFRSSSLSFLRLLSARSSDMSYTLNYSFRLGEILLKVMSYILYRITLLYCFTFLCSFIIFLCYSYSFQYLFMSIDPNALCNLSPNLVFYFSRKQSQVLLYSIFLPSQVTLGWGWQLSRDLSSRLRNVVLRLKLKRRDEYAVQFMGVRQFRISDMFFRCTRYNFLLQQSSIIQQPTPSQLMPISNKFIIKFPMFSRTLPISYLLQNDRPFSYFVRIIKINILISLNKKSSQVLNVQL